MKAYKIITNFLLMLVFALSAHQAIGYVDPVSAQRINPFVVGILLYAGQIVYHTVNLSTGKVARDITLNDTSYEGDILRQFISYAAVQFDTLRKGCINVIGGIKKKQRVPTVRVDNFIQARVETPNSNHSGTITIDARELEPQDFMGYLEFNPRDFESHVLSTEMNPMLLDAELPPTAESAIIQDVLRRNGTYLDKAVWQSEKDDAAIATAKASGLGNGDNNLIFLDGLQRKMFLDNNVYRDPSPAALTSANIVAKLEILAANAPSEVYDNPNFKFMLAGANRPNYRDAQKNQTYKGIDFTKGGVMEFDSRRIEIIHGMSANTIVGGVATMDMDSNFWLGVNELDEDSYLKLMRLANNSELYFIKMLYKMDVNYGLAEEIVFHMTETYV